MSIQSLVFCDICPLAWHENRRVFAMTTEFKSAFYAERTCETVK